MAVNKVEIGDEVIMDVSGTTVTEDTLDEGVTAINAQGDFIVGTKKGSLIGSTTVGAEDYLSPTQVAGALTAGTSIVLTNVDSNYGTTKFNSFILSQTFNTVSATCIIQVGDITLSLMLIGRIANDIWSTVIKTVPQKISELVNDTDSGWVSLTLATGVTAGNTNGASAPRGRIINGILYLDGNFKGVTGKKNGYVEFATFPETLANKITEAGNFTIRYFTIIYRGFYAVPAAMMKSGENYVLYVGSQKYSHTHTVSDTTTDLGDYSGVYVSTGEFSLCNSICLG